MADFKVFKAIVVIQVILGVACLADRTGDIPVTVPRRMCEPCSGHGLRIECVSCENCPTPVEVARRDVDEMVSSLKTVRFLVQKELRALIEGVEDEPPSYNDRPTQHQLADIPENFSKLVTIDNLTNIEDNGTLSKLLKTGVKPRYILQVVFTRTLLFSAYTDALVRIYKEAHREPLDNLENIRLELKRITCAIKDLFSNLGLKIKRGLTKRLCNYRTHINGLWKLDYMPSILWHGQQLLDDSIKDLGELVSETERCKFNCRKGKKAPSKMFRKKVPRAKAGA